jgi:hypothetical protein
MTDVAPPRHDTVRSRPTAIGAPARIGLGLVAPRSFFTTFPGAGHHWVSGLGAYNEHLVRDYAAAELGFAVLLGLAVLWPERRLVLAAGAAFLAATLPHFAYHLTTTSSFSTPDNLASLGGFAVELAVVTFAIASVPHTTTQSPRRR